MRSRSRPLPRDSCPMVSAFKIWPMPFASFQSICRLGSIDSQSGSFSLRTRGQAYSAEDFARVPIVSAGGAEVLLGDVAEIHDGFEEGEKRVEFNGKPAMFVEVMRTGQESAIEISDKVHDYVEKSRSRFPEGIDLFVYDDESVSIRGRLSTLVSSLLQGSLLVLVLLGLFLRPTLAFWIVVGIPVAFCGGILLMPWFGVTANVMSLFGFIIVVGIVVDDAIVTGENVFAKLKTGNASTGSRCAGDARSGDACHFRRADHHGRLYPLDVF